tara:strand:+ start:1 stop:1119 length:1119 start_codon:yes stop_codon:yes gene_type:complete
MPSFKPKATKKISNTSNKKVTLDVKHDEKMTEFETIEKKTIPKLKEQKKNLIDELNKKNISIEKSMLLQDKISTINKEIKHIKKNKKEYLLNNIGHVFKYFENKKTLSEDNNKTKILYSFFKKNKPDKHDDTSEVNYIQKYLTNIDEKFININDYKEDIEKCTNCNGELIAVEHEGMNICNRCGLRKQFLMTNDKPSYKEPPKEVCFYAYKRINHFREILAQFQAKETTQIPPKVIEDIKLQVKKERITIKDITNAKAKDILKKLGYNKYYEHIPFIKDKLGIRPPIMQPQLEDKLCSLFMDIQRPYSKHCPQSRVNFLNYYYVLYKMCQLLGETKYLPYFPMLKDKVKRIEQDEIWKKICNELNWEFIPTI